MCPVIIRDLAQFIIADKPAIIFIGYRTRTLVKLLRKTRKIRKWRALLFSHKLKFIMLAGLILFCDCNRSIRFLNIQMFLNNTNNQRINNLYKPRKSSSINIRINELLFVATLKSISIFSFLAKD